MQYLETVIKGIISGILSAYLVIYGLRPAMPYPEYILESFENIWLFAILLIINYYIFLWDYTIGVLMLLCIIGLVFDFIVFTTKGLKKTIRIENQNDYLNPLPAFEEKPITLEKQKSFYNVLINDIKIHNDNIYPGGPAPYN